MTADDNFLARWARRKAEVAKASEARPVEQEVDPRPDEHVEEEPFALASLPSLDQLTAETDIRPFMHKLVPRDLRNAALRRVWELDTSIRDYVSPATEYSWNFNIEGGAPGYGPLEAGFQAAKAAAIMFSSTREDHTLVGSTSTDAPAAPLASAKSPEPSEAPEELNSAAAQATVPPKVEDKTVRFSTETVSKSTINGKDQLEPPRPGLAGGPDLQSPKTFAPPKLARRHGGASPR